MRRTVGAFAAVLALAGCVGMRPTPVQPKPPRVVVTPPPVPPASAVRPPPLVVPQPERAPARAGTENELDVLLADFARARRLAPAELVREQEAARLAFESRKSDAARVRLAIMSTVPGSSPADEQRALDLLEPLVRNSAARLHGIAFLLSTYIQEHRRLATAVQGLQQSLQATHQNNQALQQNVQALQQKLEALRTLERSLSERGESALRRRTQ